MKNILILLVTIYLTLKLASTNPIQDVPYVERINFEYKNGSWICGDAECHKEATGCHILIRIFNDNKKVLYQAFICIGAQEAADRIELLKEKVIDIDLKTYHNAVSVYSVGYGLGGNEYAKGVIAVDKLQVLKEEFKRIKEEIENSNA